MLRWLGCAVAFFLLIPVAQGGCRCCFGLPLTFREEAKNAVCIVYGTVKNPRIIGPKEEGVCELFIHGVLKSHPLVEKTKVLVIPRYVNVPDPNNPPRYVVLFDVHEGKRHVPAETGSTEADLPLLGEHDLDAVCSLVTTSGTSGGPHAVGLTYGNHLWSAVGSAFNLGVDPADRWLCCLPLHHVGGLSILMRSVIYGTGAVVHPGFDPGQVERSLAEDEVTLVSRLSPNVDLIHLFSTTKSHLVRTLAAEWEAWAKRANVDPWTGARRLPWGDDARPGTPGRTRRPEGRRPRAAAEWSSGAAPPAPPAPRRACSGRRR